MTEQSQVKHELLFCARVLLGNIRRIFLLKNLGYWNAYSYYYFSFSCRTLTKTAIKRERVIRLP